MEKTISINFFIFLFLCIVVSIFPSHSFAQAYLWHLDFDTSTEPVSTAQLDTWEKLANDGDMSLQRQFAESYLIRMFGRSNDCSHLDNQHRCRAMQTRLGVGEKFARQTAELTAPENDIRERKDIAYFQRWYGQKRYRESTHPSSEACVDALRFTTQALNNGQICAARLLSEMARLGRCMPRNEELGGDYVRLSAGRCPIF